DGVTAAMNVSPPAAAISTTPEERRPGSRSFSSVVPAALPSLRQGSRPWVPSSAVKNSVPLTSVSSCGNEARGPGAPSFTSRVPLLLPSVRHSSSGCPGSVPTKKSWLPETAGSARKPSHTGALEDRGGLERQSVVACSPSTLNSTCPWTSKKPPSQVEREARRVSRRVPAALPSLLCSSALPAAGRAPKSRRPWTLHKPQNADDAAPGERSAASNVPAAVPSLAHSSSPWIPSFAVKKIRPFTSVRWAGEEERRPSAMSLTSTGWPWAPAMGHSSRPSAGSSPTQYSLG